MSFHSCPTCQTPLEPNPRYPQYICSNCTKKTTDKDGRIVEFLNEEMNGGIKGRYTDNKQPYTKTECFVNGTKCIAAEAHMGGIIISANTSMQPQSIGVKMNGSYIFLLTFLGIFSFGIVPLLYKLLVLKRHPQTIDEKGVTMKNGTFYSWDKLERVEQAHVSMYGLTEMPGAIELYFKADKMAYITVPLKFIHHSIDIMHLIAGVCRARNITMTHKSVSIRIPKKI
jgi:hypothetical protein